MTNSLDTARARLRALTLPDEKARLVELAEMASLTPEDRAAITQAGAKLVEAIRGSDDPGLKDTCVSTTFTVTGTVTCSSQVCDFEKSNESDPPWSPNKPFGIPPSQFNLLAKTESRGTEIVPAYCFSTEHDGDIVANTFDPEAHNAYAVPGLTLNNINGFWLRSPVVSTADAEGKWWAHVWAHSDDMNGVERQYRFNFGGECNSDGGVRCPKLRDGNFTGDFENGFAGGVFGENTNPRGDGQTCRCTVSSKPGCPDHVDLGDGVPRPASYIKITEKQLPQS